MTGQHSLSHGAQDQSGTTTDLVRKADDCIARLTEVQTHVANSKPSYHSKESKELLDQTEARIRKNAALLGTWKDSLASRGQTSDQNGIRIVAENFATVESHLRNAENALERRLEIRYRNMNAWRPGAK